MIAVSLFVVASIISLTHGRAVDPHKVDSYGNRVFLVREQRNPMAIYPHRSMMITGVYQPKHRASSRQATGVFAQGNAVSSDAFLAANIPKYTPEIPESIDEPEISSAEAQAAPGPYETPVVDENQADPGVENNEDELHDQKNIQTQQEEEAAQYPSGTPEPESPTVPQKGAEQSPAKPKKPLKGKKTKVHTDDNDDDEADYVESDDEDDIDEEQPAIFNPFKGNRRGAMSAHTNFFPMVFSFPKTHGRKSSSGSLPGMITAIANSYSTGKSGIASSVATAYGGSPNSKKKLQKSHQE